MVVLPLIILKLMRHFSRAVHTPRDTFCTCLGFGGHLIGLIQLVACATVALTQAWVVFDIDGDGSLHCGVDDTRNDTYCPVGVPCVTCAHVTQGTYQQCQKPTCPARQCC